MPFKSQAQRAGAVRERSRAGEEVREGDAEGGEAPGEGETEAVVITTPGTRLTWSNGTEWAAQAEVLRNGRGISAKVHRDRASHLKELSSRIHEMVARAANARGPRGDS